MAKKDVLIGAEARDAVMRGVDLVADTVKVTLGPLGRNVILDTDPYANPTITNDGVTIAREIKATGKYAATGAKIVKEVAGKTNDVAGDGTTTASVLVQAIIHSGLQQLAIGANPQQLRREIEGAGAAVLEAVRQQKTPIEDVEKLTAIATISCGDAKLGKLIARLVKKVGANGVLTIEDAEEAKTSTRVTEGIELRGGIMLPVFITNVARQVAELDNVPIFVTDHDITNAVEVIKIMEACHNNNHKSAVLIANSIQGEAMANCVVNWAQSKFKLLPIRVQAFGEQGAGVLRDMAAATGANFFAKDEGHRLPDDINGPGYEFSDFGFAERIIASKDRTNIIGGDGERETRIKELKAQVKNLTRAFEKEQMEERIAKLESGVGVVRVAGITESERTERKLRVEDAINAAKAALADGVVPGGGAALYRAANRAFEGQTKSAGNTAIKKACEAPLRQMAINSGFELDQSKLAAVCEEPGKTIDFRTSELVVGMEAGIIDPLKVVVTALENAVSAAGLFLTSEAAVVRVQDTSEKL